MGYLTWWSTDLPLWWRDLDALGHVTAASYPVLYQEAMARFVDKAWQDPCATYVVRHLSIDYQREIRREDAPIRVYVATRRVGTTSFELASVMCAADGRARSSSETRYVAWDEHHRHARRLTDQERSSLLRSMA